MKTKNLEQKNEMAHNFNKEGRLSNQSYVEISLPGDWEDETEFKVNWSGCGANTTDSTERFAERLQEAVELCKKLNGQEAQ